MVVLHLFGLVEMSFLFGSSQLKSIGVVLIKVAFTEGLWSCEEEEGCVSVRFLVIRLEELYVFVTFQNDRRPATMFALIQLVLVFFASAPSKQHNCEL